MSSRRSACLAFVLIMVSWTTAEAAAPTAACPGKRQDGRTVTLTGIVSQPVERPAHVSATDPRANFTAFKDARCRLDVMMATAVVPGCKDGARFVAVGRLELCADAACRASFGDTVWAERLTCE